MGDGAGYVPWWKEMEKPERKMKEEPVEKKTREIMGGPGSVPKKMPMMEERKREEAPKEKSPEAEKAKDDANAAKEKVKAAGAPGPEKPKAEGPEVAKEAALKKAGEAIKGES